MTSRVPIFEFHESSPIESILDIDWPKIHAAVGIDEIRWLNSQHIDRCQMVLEVEPDKTKRLVAEFYDEELAKTYHLMWAK